MRVFLFSPVLTCPPPVCIDHFVNQVRLVHSVFIIIFIISIIINVFSLIMILISYIGKVNLIYFKFIHHLPFSFVVAPQYYSNHRTESRFVFVMPENPFILIVMRFGGVKFFHEISKGTPLSI